MRTHTNVASINGTSNIVRLFPVRGYLIQKWLMQTLCHYDVSYGLFLWARRREVSDYVIIYGDGESVVLTVTYGPG